MLYVIMLFCCSVIVFFHNIMFFIKQILRLQRVFIRADVDSLIPKGVMMTIL